MSGRSNVPKVVRDALRSDGAYDLGLGVVLRAPKDIGARGGSASYRVEHRDEPVIPGRPMAKRRQSYRRDLEVAYALALELSEEMRDRASGTYVEYATDTLFGEVVRRWYDSPHPRWGEQYPAKVRSLLRNWVVAESVTIIRRGRRHPVPIAELPIGGLRADDYNQALEHVRRARAYRTYTEVHGLVVQIVKWAVTNQYLRPTDMTVVHQLPLAVPDGDEEQPRGSARPVDDEAIPPAAMIQGLAETAERLFDTRTRLLVDLLAYTGLRISEALALRNDDRFVHDEMSGVWRLHVREQVHKTHRRTLPPKWRKRRWAFVPSWLGPELAQLLDDTATGALLFPSPGRRVRGADGRIERVGVGLHPYDAWSRRRWEKMAEATAGWPEREDWWPPDAGSAPRGTQSERRWRWSTHSLRHHAATFMLNDLGLDPDDVASFLGHRSGRQVWEMYVRVRPDLYGRASAASRRAGDPRG